MRTEEQIRKLISEVRYQSKDITVKDATAVVKEFPGLKPRIEMFTFNNGAKKNLLVLRGTIRVPYRGNKYNIPVSIWLLDTHPVHAPMTFVSPTSDMTIRQGRHVDMNGVVYLPYLHSWNAKSSLVTLIRTCIDTFSQDCPVYSKVSPQTVATHSSQSPTVSDPRHSLPYPMTTANHVASPVTAAPSSTLPYPIVGPTSGGTLPYLVTPTHSPHQSTVPLQPALSSAQPTTDDASTVKASLVSAVQEKVRRALHDEFATKLAQMESLVKVKSELTTNQQRLKTVLSQMESELANLNASCDQLVARREELVVQMSDLKSNNEAIDCDQLVTVEPGLHSQLLMAHAEDAAFGDVIYYLGEALGRQTDLINEKDSDGQSKQLSCESYLKAVRQASRRQFFLRLTVIKCRQKAGI